MSVTCKAICYVNNIGSCTSSQFFAAVLISNPTVYSFVCVIVALSVFCDCKVVYKGC